MKLSRRWILRLVVPLVLFCSVAACPADQACLAIGATVSSQGRYQEPSTMIRKAFELWRDEVNQRGGLLGRKVKLILYDDQGKPDLARAGYKKLIEEDKVDLVFAPYGTPLTMAASEVSEQHKFTMLACGAAGDGIWQRGYHYVFGMYAPAERYFIGMLDIMARHGLKSVALLYDRTSSFNLDVLRGAEKWAHLFNIQVTYRKAYACGDGGLADAVAELHKANAESVLLSAYAPDCYELLRLLAENHYRPAVLGMTIAPAYPDFPKNADGRADRVFGPSQWEPNERIPFPGTRNFIQAFRHFTGQMPSYHAGSAYAACQLVEQAVLKTGSTDNEKIRNYIAGLDTVTIIGRFKVDAAGKQIGHNPMIIQWQQGRKEIVWPPKMRTAPPLL